MRRQQEESRLCTGRIAALHRVHSLHKRPRQQEVRASLISDAADTLGLREVAAGGASDCPEAETERLPVQHPRLITNGHLIQKMNDDS